MSQSSSTGANAISGVVTTDHPPEVLVHGLLDDPRIWDEVAAELAWQSKPMDHHLRITPVNPLPTREIP
jgi:hypothetical protein